MVNFEKIGRFCSNLERIVELEKLISGEGQNPIVNSVMLPQYQEEHNRLIAGVNSYLAKNYPDGSFAVVWDMWNYMQERQKDKIEEAIDEYDHKNACKVKQRADLLKSIEGLKSVLEEYQRKYSIE